ncbi:hypothetical protein GUJ93_ZPchr0010g7896 [Zizania palustris]|uniref:Uncharacterized protein n=1 Tax=Zizania palustris TaxID=103762 RepID=A0A8J5WAZ3_ZIZPA|nr:hypothetical protein GUJ93_ZPchr0010g7896 [Zizania palustris]
MDIETDAARTGSEAAIAARAATATARRGWLRRLIPRDYLSRLRRWKLGAAAASGGGGGGGGAGVSMLASLSRSLRWKRLPGFSLRLRSGSASAVVDVVVFRVMYVVEAVVLGLALSCFFLCCGCHL